MVNLMKELGTLGKQYQNGETIGHQNDPADAFYVVQEGKVAVVYVVGDREIVLAICGPGEIIGDWAIDSPHQYTPLVRADGTARVLTVQRRLLMQRVHEDPSLAFRILEVMSRRIQSLTDRLIKS
jgi:CRP/FNR family transcriptional regulator